MWFFMYTCYIFSLLSLALLSLTGLQGYFGFYIMNANHPTFALLATMIYLFTETLIIFFFVGTGVSIKEYTHDKNLCPIYRQESNAIKRKVYPPMLLNMLLVMTLFISGGAVDTHRFSPNMHGILFLVCLLHFLYVIVVQHNSFKENTELILKMSGVEA